ncbi:multisubunit sodium/proton antiporter MrpA subunit /multisubunit sodium/proton antiporter MrpB subunit [Curtobacterium sp. PhB130]|uniref:Na+/H+ antiporter subunit A n=1 Tax=Curtobacterium sp. PhB130 TaxID=2485178 RepID=UPI000F4B6F14|nr:Na+/H+ antiporter subunit A [Curtobacterium sp. PhB130]ROS78041.1 multisubunit sodium/proton antiporter MrpA subunit /multisubunit sodium/proton antiporter MrpB subunit [Curtobacterium sp. PhB130]
MVTVLVAFAVIALVVPALTPLLGRRVFYVAALAPAAAAVLTLAQTDRALHGGVSESFTWIPQLDLSIAFRVDALSWVLALVVSVVGALVLVYCASYFGPDEPGLGRFAGVLTAFAGSMYGLVIADDVIVLFVLWEATTVFSYLLIGHDAAKRASRAAAMQALVVTTAGGLAMLAGLVMLSVTAGTTRLSAIIADAPTGTIVTVSVVLILAGALTKSAIVPFHFWLPAAMAAPTPVSAYLHAAAMVKAGIYLVARLAPAFALLEGWRETITVLGVLGMVIGGYRALRQNDLKLLLAYGTVAQLGFLVLAAGWGTPAIALGGVALLVAHATFKSTLFLVVGTIDHVTGTRDLGALSGLGRKMPWLTTVAVLALVSMAGIPPTIGFVAKEAVLTGFIEALHGPGSGWAWFALVGITVGSILTVAYSLRFLWGAFGTKPGVEPTEPHALHGLGVVPSILGLAGLALGLFTPVVAHGIEPAATAASMSGAEAVPHLALWHGLEPALGISAITLLGGLALFAARSRVEALQHRLAGFPSAANTYRHVMRGLDRGATAITAGLQRGSLPYYLTVILSVFVAGALANLVLGGPWQFSIRFADSWGQIPVVLVMSVAAIAVTTAKTRFAAAVLVGVTGYGMSVLFVLHGAVDLALTQLVVETVTLIAFVLVLRRLPPRIATANPSRFRLLRALFAALAGVTLAIVVIVAASARTAEPIWPDIPALTSSFGHGLNVVNVALVDLRGWDTLGELTVVVAAATGVASLIFVNSREDTLPRLRDLANDVTNDKHRPDGEPRAWLPTSAALPTGRSALLDVVVRLLFHGLIVLSVYLLFAGHNAAGGGFAGGLVAGIALAARYLAGGPAELGAAAPVRAGRLLGLGVATAAVTAIVPLFFGREALYSEFFEATVPVLGHVEFVTATFFDIGVYLVVVGLVLDVLRSLGAEVDRQRLEDSRVPTNDTIEGNPEQEGVTA